MNEDNPREGMNEQQAEVDVDITEITSADIEMALRNMKNGKAAGHDNLPVEVWKRPCEKRKHQGETEGREYHRQRCAGKRDSGGLAT